MPTCDSQLIDSLPEEGETMRRLLQLVEQEQALLLAANLEELASLTEEKAKTVARMAALAHRRHQLLATAGFDASETGMQAWIASSGASSARETWREMCTRTAAAQELNRTNGLLISRHMTRNQTALNILQGAGQAGGFYGPNGQSTVKPPVRNRVIG